MKHTFNKEPFNTALQNLLIDPKSALFQDQVVDAIRKAPASQKKSLILTAFASLRSFFKNPQCKYNLSDFEDVVDSLLYCDQKLIVTHENIIEIADAYILAAEVDFPYQPELALKAFYWCPKQEGETLKKAEEFAIQKIVEGRLSEARAESILAVMLSGQPGMQKLRWKRFYIKLEAAQKAKAEQDAAAKPEPV
jgi:hypothetical protein